MNDSTRERKQALRREVLEKRASFSEETWKKKSKVIIEALKDTDFFKEAKVVHTYLSMNQRREITTDDLVESMLKGNKRVVVPVTNFSDGTLSHSEITSTSELQTNKWGVKEPKTTRDVDPEIFDLIIIPMAAADRDGNRLGYGKGFYDRFLAQSPAKKVGLVFHDFIFDKIPTEGFDEKLDLIISEEEMIFS
jgi:5-formyltetrahydrofolate cyclo-ligase